MTVSRFDSYRPPELPRRRRAGGGKKRRSNPDAGRDGGREMAMVPDAEFTSYYGRPIVKAPPWGPEIPGYLFLGGLAGGSALLAFGADLTGRLALRRAGRLSALGAAGVGTVLLVMDLGRPERFLHMLRTFKPTSPMSIGSWLLAAFASNAGVAAAVEVDRMTGGRLPLGPLRAALTPLEKPAAALAALLGAPVAVYTAALLSDTAVPTWNAMHEDLPFVFASSATLGASGLAMIAAPPREARPARALAAGGVVADLVATRVMKTRMDPVAAEPLTTGKPGRWLAWSERLSVAGALGALLGGRRRWVAAASGAALVTASMLTRFAVFYAGIDSAADPRYTVEPQKARLAARRAAGVTGDATMTAR